MSRRSATTIGFVAGLALAMLATAARAQTNIDQGKSSAEIFASDCAVCHKTTRGLADGKNSLMLSGFLREHYTASRDQAAALAAYVLGAGGNGPAPAGQKQGAARAALEEPKAGEPKTGEPKAGDAKTAAHPAHPPAAAKLERPKDEEAKPEGEASPAASPQRLAPARHEAPAVASRSEKQEPEPAPSVQVPVSPPVAPVVGGPPTTAQAPDPDLNPAPNATTAGEAQPGESVPVPRDAIPD